MKDDKYIIENSMRRIIDKLIVEQFERILNEKNISIKHRGEFLFPYRSEVVKKTYSSLIIAGKHIRKKYPRELKFSGKIYPKIWMLNDPKIMSTMDRYPLLIQILNFIFDYTRYKKGDEYKKMVAICDKVSNKSKYTRKLNSGASRRYDYASFVADQQFYDTITKKFGCSKILIKKYIQELKQANIILEIGRYKRQRVYADGYFVTIMDGRLRKISFLIKTPAFKNALRCFFLKR